MGLDEEREPPETCGHRRDLLRRQDCLRARNRADQSGTRHSRSREEGLAKDRHRRIAVVAADVRYETWLGFGRPGSRISTQDHNTPGTGPSSALLDQISLEDEGSGLIFRATD